MKLSAQFSVPLEVLVKQAAAKYKVDAGAILRKLALDIYTEIIKGNPVKTGRSRANWNLSLHTPNFTTSNSTIPSFVEIPPGSLKNLPLIYISNGLPYVRELEYGKSDQAPSGFIRLAIQKIKIRGV